MKYAALLISFLLCIEYWSQNVEGADCSTSSGRKGECQPITTSCATLSENLSLTICDLSQTVPFICCPVPFDEGVKPDVTNSVCGLRPKTSELLRVERHIQSMEPISLIINGTVSAPHSWPWIVSVQMNNYGTFNHLCGGTIISERYVLSAAHCFDRETVRFPENYVIKAGRHNSTDGVNYSIEEIKRHPLYIDLFVESYDIALLKIKGFFSFNDVISPACLPSIGDDFTGEIVRAIGWGETESSGSLSQVLREIAIPVLRSKICYIYYHSVLHPFTNSLLCTSTREGGKSFSHGDSGGPLLHQDHASLKWKVIGIASFGNNITGVPNFFTRVSSYLPWITENMDN